MIIVIRKRNIIYTFAILFAFIVIAQLNISCIQTVLNADPLPQKIIVVDAGHGGRDPGAISKNGTKEKHINLEISKKVKALLEKKGYKIVMTREEDIILADEGVRNRKASDIRNRKKIINESNGELLVSIHLNSFSQSKYYGAQVFYPPSSEKSKLLGEIIQQELKSQVDNTNKRLAKTINTVLLLKNLKIPAVIVECGFLSNTREEGLLKTEEHQQKIANAIVSGVETYLSEVENIEDQE